MSTPSSLPRRQRRELAAMIALIAATAICAPAVPLAGAVLAAAFALLWALTASDSHELLENGLRTYHAPPFARACDCVVALARHARRLIAEPSRGALVDTALALAFFGLIVAAIAVLELDKHAPHLTGDGVAVGVATGVAGWHIALELTHEPERLARYRRRHEQPIRYGWVFPALLLAELAVFVVLEQTDELPHQPFLRGLLTGIAAIGLADYASLGSTLVAIATRGRPLR